MLQARGTRAVFMIRSYFITRAKEIKRTFEQLHFKHNKALFEMLYHPIAPLLRACMIVLPAWLWITI